MEQTTERVTLALSGIQADGQHTLQDDVDAAFARVEAAIREHMAANLGERPTKPYRIAVVLDISAVHTDLREVTGRVETTFPKSGRKHKATLIGRDGQMVLDKPAGQEPLPLEPGKRMAMVG